MGRRNRPGARESAPRTQDDRTLICYGLHAVQAAIAKAPETLLEAWIREGSLSETLTRVETGIVALGVSLQRVSVDALDRLAGAGTHQGIVLRRRMPAPFDFDTWLETRVRPDDAALVLAIDQIQDPHNLGAALRLADATGVCGILLPRDRTAGLSPAVAKVASGALDTVPLVTVPNLVRALERLKEAGLWVVGACGEAQASLYHLDLARPLVWVIGGEGDGLRRLTRETCDYLARIPMRGSVESLNLGTATAVCLFETLRQRGVT